MTALTLVPTAQLHEPTLFELYQQAWDGLEDSLGAPALEFRVEGLPAPQGSKTPLGVTKDGRVMMRESSKKVKPWRAEVTAAALAALPSGWRPLEGPVVASMTFVMPRLKAKVPAVRRGMPATYPDMSKMIRSTEDAMTAEKLKRRAKDAPPLTEAQQEMRRALLFTGVWKDDGQVVDVICRKRYQDGEGDLLGHDGALVRVWAMP